MARKGSGGEGEVSGGGGVFENVKVTQKSKKKLKKEFEGATRLIN